MRRLFLDSRDRVSGTSTDFTIQLPETLVIEGNRRGRIDNLRIPLVIPTIRSGINDTLIVRIGTTSYTIQIPQGNYDGIGLASVIQTALGTATSIAWSCSYDVTNVAMTLTCPSSNFVVTGGSYAAQLMTHPYTHTGNSYTFTYVSVLGIDMLYLSSSKFSNLDIVGPQGSHDTLASIVVTEAFSNVIDYSMPADVWFDVGPITTQTLDFQLRDMSYNVLSIVPNISLTLTID